MHSGRQLVYFKTDRALFFRKIHFSPNLDKKGPKWPQKRFLWIFWKILSLIFLGNNLKWKLLLLLIFQHQSHIWQNSGSSVLSQNAVRQSNCRILWNVISCERNDDNVYFSHADKHWNLLQVNTIILGVCSKACLICPKFAYLCNIFRKAWGMKLIFCLQINTKVF